MIEKGYMYKHEPGEEDVIRITRGEENEVIFNAPDNYTIDVVAADEQVNTIIVMLRRKEEKGGGR